jgi:L-fucose isomerase-like protein
MSIDYRRAYPAADAPRVGIVHNSVAAFVEDGKQFAESAFMSVINDCIAQGIIAADSVIYPERICGPHDAWKVVDVFAKAQLDAIVIHNSAFPNGHVLPIITQAPHLRHLPVVLAAYEETNDEVGSREWVTNSVCGNDMNMHDALYMGRYVRYLAGTPGAPEFAREFAMLMNVYRCVRNLSRMYLGRFGDGPGGFHSATGDQLLFAKVFGVIVETVDLLRVYRVYTEMQTSGPKGDFSFTEEDVQATLKEMLAGRINLVDDIDGLYRSARLYHALVTICRAEGFNAASFRCWPEIAQPPLEVVGCLPIAWATAKQDVASFACEGDWPGGVIQAIANWLTGKPAAFLDFVDWTAKRDIVKFGHCGVGLCGHMAPNDPAVMAEIAANGGKVSDDLRKRIMAGEVVVNEGFDAHSHFDYKPCRYIGQLEYGPKTGLDLVQTPGGGLQMLAFSGENSAETAQGVLYCGCDLRIKNYEKLDEIKRTRGFSHHMVMALDDIVPELRELCAYFGVDFITPDD